MDLRDYLCAMNRVSLLKVFVAGCVALTLQSCDFRDWMGSKDFVRIGYSQTQLRKLFEDRCGVPLADNEKVLNAYSGGGRHPSFWFQASFDPQGGTSLRERFLERGYVVITERKYDVLGDTRVPEAIGSWWDPAVIEEATLFILQRTPVTPRAIPLVVCFVDERRGTLFAYSLPN